MNELIKIITDEEDRQLVSARELYDFLELKKRFSVWIYRFIRNGNEFNFIKGVNFFESYKSTTVNNNAERVLKDYFITLQMAEIICQKIRATNKTATMLNYLYKINGVKNIVFYQERREIQFLDKLEESFKPFNIKGIRQYKILTYRIDYYIPKLNIAIEYDENDHKNYTYKQHELRQKQIEKELGCNFIRLSDSKSDAYNIGFVLKEIIEKGATI
ncbi:hypothetical protein FJ641_07515 [Clostridium perfringens]|nr:hypothetical protein [Clostridium perfringens]